MAVNKPFNRYILYMFGTLTNNVIARLYCYQDNVWAGRIDFYADGVYLPVDYLHHPNPRTQGIILNMPMSRLEEVMATVRQEEPLRLWINFDPDPPPATTTRRVGGYGLLATSMEPVGEEESGP
jgi:hypothetical protein